MRRKDRIPMAKIGDICICKECGAEYTKTATHQYYCSTECAEIAAIKRMQERSQRMLREKGGRGVV